MRLAVCFDARLVHVDFGKPVRDADGGTSLQGAIQQPSLMAKRGVHLCGPSKLKCHVVWECASDACTPHECEV